MRRSAYDLYTSAINLYALVDVFSSTMKNAGGNNARKMIVVINLQALGSECKSGDDLEYRCFFSKFIFLSVYLFIRRVSLDNMVLH